MVILAALKDVLGWTFLQVAIQGSSLLIKNVTPKFALGVISLLVSWEGSRAWRSFNGPGVEVLHITSDHILADTPKCKGSWEIQSSCRPRRRRKQE